MRQEIGNLLRVNRRLQSIDPFGAHRRQREARDSLDDAIEFEGSKDA
jgi:hypothetical protein